MGLSGTARIFAASVVRTPFSLDRLGYSEPGKPAPLSRAAVLVVADNLNFGAMSTSGIAHALIRVGM